MSRREERNDVFLWFIERVAFQVQLLYNGDEAKQTMPWLYRDKVFWKIGWQSDKSGQRFTVPVASCPVLLN